MNGYQTIFQINKTYTWLREPLLARLPDDSLCCVIFTGGQNDGALENVVAAVRSDDNGSTWSDLEILASQDGESAWAPSMFVHEGKAHIFWYTSKDRKRYRKTNRVLSTGDDGRTFVEDRIIQEDWITEFGVDIRHGTYLRDGRVLLGMAWMEPLKECDLDWKCDDPDSPFFHFEGAIASANRFCIGLLEPDDTFNSFTPYGRICKDTPNETTTCIYLIEPAIAELSDGTISVLMRADLTNRLWRSDSSDGGRTWSEPIITDIPNPGSKPRILNLPDGRIVLFHNPNEKDWYELPKPRNRAENHKYRTPLEMWVSNDDLNSWYIKKTLHPVPHIAQYPDGFLDVPTQTIFLVWEDDDQIFFKKIPLSDLE